MLSAKKIMYKKLSLLGISFVLGISLLQAQTENSPYSRYGLGDLVPSQNILNRGMGGASAAYFDFQSVNFVNPASYSRLKVTTLDIGAELDSRTLRTIDPPKKYNSISPNISYVQIGIPLSQKRNWGMNIGLRPITRISYNVQSLGRMEGIDSVRTIYEGSGGSYQVYTGTGFSIGKLSLGFNVSYLFGSKDFSSQRFFIADSANTFYFPANYSYQASYGGLMLNSGVQFRQRLSKNTVLQLGAYGNLKRNLRASRDEKIETIQFSQDGSIQRIDSVRDILDVKGQVTYPTSYGLGFMIAHKDKYLFAADYSSQKWSEFRFFNETDRVQDSWKFNVGGQILPNALNPKSYWGRVAYRVGFMYGKDYINVDKDLPTYAITFGAGLPMRRAQYTNQHSVINTSLEFGRRGNKENVLSENFFRFSVGFTLSDIWFIKRQYQ